MKLVMIVHYMVDNDFEERGLQFASTYVTENALAVFSSNQHQSFELSNNFIFSRTP